MILLIGGNGYVGKAFQRELTNRELAYQVVSRKDVDYYRVDRLLEVIADTRATFLINAAGYTGKPNVDACELHKHECLLGNAVLPGVVLDACQKANIPWGHVSSGCIYQGCGPNGNGFTEMDAPNFCFRANNGSFYSGTKALGEEILMEAQRCYVWRLRIPFDHRDSDRNYISKLLRYERLLDACNSISHLDDFTGACIDCWQRDLPYGIYNVTNTGSVSTREIVKLIQKHLQPRRGFEFFKNEEEFMSLVAKTPRSNCVLDNQKLRGLGVEIPEVLNAVERALTLWT